MKALTRLGRHPREGGDPGLPKDAPLRGAAWIPATEPALAEAGAGMTVLQGVCP